MRPAHISLLVLLIYVSRTHCYGLVSITAALSSDRLDAEPYIACLSNSSIKLGCMTNWTEVMWSNKNLTETAAGVVRDGYRQIRIPIPWTSEMYLVVRNSEGRRDVIDVSHLRPWNGSDVIKGITVLGGLRISANLTCWYNQYGPECLKGCIETLPRYTCNRDTGDKICLGYYYGERCNELDCQNDGFFDNKTYKCSCSSGWSGQVCQLPVVVDCSSSSSNNSSSCEQVPRTHDQQQRSSLGLGHFTLIILLLSILLAFSLVVVVVCYRRTRTARGSIIASSLEVSSHHLLAREDSEDRTDKIVDYSNGEIV